MAKHHNPNLVKINRSYTVEEAANIFPVHKNTVRSWIKNGLEICGNQKPWLILGSELKEFIQLKRKKNKQTCKPYEMYCFSCRAPKRPAGNMADYEPMNASRGCLIGICSTCDGIINKYFSLAKLVLIHGKLDVTLPKAQKHISKRDDLLLNSDLNK
ncbi:MAG: DNA-binding protein [Gammaproteobacteria bacterium]|nr:MAG: DNA-binding protein [Gammaproteobacteria bacterium]